ncbi:MAG TPA: ABC transporter C-terminal domain-containing protein, partial [Saprospiraceae bacterium]|nr:ABC transporter C-terminal domain-containing protein [Saprospiraceae bacterium]
QQKVQELQTKAAELERKKSDIMAAFDNPDISADQAAKLSIELGQLQETLDRKEMRWFELSEK